MRIEESPSKFNRNVIIEFYFPLKSTFTVLEYLVLRVLPGTWYLVPGTYLVLQQTTSSSNKKQEVLVPYYLVPGTRLRQYQQQLPLVVAFDCYQVHYSKLRRQRDLCQISTKYIFSFSFSSSENAWKAPYWDYQYVLSKMEGT